MTQYVATNNGYSTLAGTLTDVATSLTVVTGHGDRFPVVTNGVHHTYLTLEDASSNIEIVKVTARASGSNSMTITRGQGGTTARAWNVGDIAECRFVVGIFDDKADASALAAHLADTADAHAASAITNTPAGNVSATTVQAAIDELDTKKLDKSGGTMTGDLTMGVGKKIIFDGATDDAFELTVDPGEPTADRTQTHQDASGTLALVGVREVIGCFPAGSMKAQNTNGPAPLSWEESSTYKVMQGFLAFDASTQEYAQFSFRAPTALDETAGFAARFVWKEAAGATSHDCLWQVEMQAQGDGDTIDSAWGTAVTVLDTGTSGTRRITDVTTTITPGGSWAAGDEIVVRVSRKAADGTDTLNVDAHLLEVVLLANYASSVEA